MAQASRRQVGRPRAVRRPSPVCDREAEIEAFRTDEYWTVEATLATTSNEEFPARLQAIDRTTLKKLDIKDEASAFAIKRAIEKGEFRVASVESRDAKRNPYAPFATSTLQMDASRKLGFSAKQTMQVAQRLYEGVDVGGETVGLITYMRTDGVTIIPEAIGAIRGMIAREYSQRYVAPFIREYKTKAKNAQEAHEAIRPTDVTRTPASVARYLQADQAEALRADLEARRRKPDGLRRDEADDRRHRGQRPRRQGVHDARHRLDHAVRRLPQGLRGRPRRSRAARSNKGKDDRRRGRRR